MRVPALAANLSTLAEALARPNNRPSPSVVPPATLAARAFADKSNAEPATKP